MRLQKIDKSDPLSADFKYRFVHEPYVVLASDFKTLIKSIPWAITGRILPSQRVKSFSEGMKPGYTPEFSQALQAAKDSGKYKNISTLGYEWRNGEVQ